MNLVVGRSTVKDLQRCRNGFQVEKVQLLQDQRCFHAVLRHFTLLWFYSAANEEYYQLLMINDSQPSGLDVSSYTIEEIDSITSEYTLKNNVSQCSNHSDTSFPLRVAALTLLTASSSQQDIFAVAVSLNTGRIVYISDQAASILNCKRDVFKNTKFVEFLTPQDVSVFYSFTTPYRLPSWSMCTGAGTGTSLQTHCSSVTVHHMESGITCLWGGWLRYGKNAPTVWKFSSGDRLLIMLTVNQSHKKYLRGQKIVENVSQFPD